MFVFGVCIEARAGFGCKISVSMYGSVGVAIVQILQELHDGYLLRLSSCIFRGLAIYSKTPDITDTDTVCVVFQAVCTGLGDWSPSVHAAVAIDDVMVADILEFPCEVPTPDVRNSVVAPLWGCATVYDEFTDCSHLRLPVVVVRRNTF